MMNNRTKSTCGIPWPVCCDCLGQGLSTSQGLAICPKCFRTWPVAEVVPCSWPIATSLVDGKGGELAMCASHAAHPSGGNFTRAEVSGKADD